MKNLMIALLLAPFILSGCLENNGSNNSSASSASASNQVATSNEKTVSNKGCTQGNFKNAKELNDMLNGFHGKPAEELIKVFGHAVAQIGDSWEFAIPADSSYDFSRSFCSENDIYTQKPARLGFEVSVADGKVTSHNVTIIPYFPEGGEKCQKNANFKNKTELEKYLKGFIGQRVDQIILKVGRPSFWVPDSNLNVNTMHWGFHPYLDGNNPESYCSEPNSITGKNGSLGFMFSFEKGVAITGEAIFQEEKK